MTSAQTSQRRRTSTAQAAQQNAANAQATQRGRRGLSASRTASTRGPVPRTRQQLYQEAKARNIKGRSTMTKAELARALGL
jgi:hypothetical protein